MTTTISGPDLALTPRELECLGALARGLRQEAVGEQLGISRATVELHINNARKKLDALTSAHAVAIAISRGLISL
jgi:DNA-binding CsgD family transcriptional regulator